MVNLSDILKQPLVLLGTALVLAAFGISMFFEGGQGIHYAPAALCLLVFSCLCILPALWRGLEVPVAPAALLMLALWFYVTMSLSWSSVPYASLVTYLIFLTCPLAFFAPLLSHQREDCAKFIALALFAAIIVAAGWAVIQFVFLRDIYGPRAHHPLPSPNNLAGLINLALLPALAFYLTGPRRPAVLALVLVLFAGLVATESRGGLISALIASGVLLAVLRGDKQKILPLLGGSAALFAALGFLTRFNFAGRLAALAAMGSDGPSLARFAIWKNAWDMVHDHLWVGTGFGTFYLYYPGYRDPGVDDSTGNWAHMDPLQYWAELGIAAPLLLYAIAIAVLLRTVRAIKALPPEATKERAGIMGLFCGLLALILHTHADFHLYIMPILIVTGAWLALWYVLTAQALNDRAWHAIPLPGWQRPFMAGVALCIAGLIGIMTVSSAMGQHHLVRAHNLIEKGMVEQFTAAIEEAEKWAPRSFIDPEVQLAALYIDLLGKNASALFSPEEQKHLYDQAQQLLDIAASQNPPWSEIYYQRGLLYKEAEPDKALAALEQAVAKNPMHFRAREELAQHYIKRGQVEKAWTTLETGLKYPHIPEIDGRYIALMNSISGLVKIKRDYDETVAAQPQEQQ